jgi:hypothetical protein
MAGKLLPLAISRRGAPTTAVRRTVVNKVVEIQLELQNKTRLKCGHNSKLNFTESLSTAPHVKRVDAYDLFYMRSLSAFLCTVTGRCKKCSQQNRSLLEEVCQRVADHQ